MDSVLQNWMIRSETGLLQVILRPKLHLQYFNLFQICCTTWCNCTTNPKSTANQNQVVKYKSTKKIKKTNSQYI